MKLFGGMNSAKSASRKAGNKRTKKAKPAKGSPEAKKRRNQILLISCLVVLAIFLSGYGFVKSFVKPPSLTGSFGDPDTNDPGGISTPPSIHDPEIDGDMPNVSGASRKENYFTVLIACTDKDDYNTDSMIMASFDAENGEVNLLNIPRDTIIDADWNIRRINASYGVGKIDRLKKEVGKLLGIPVDRYVIFSFDGVADVVDALGGVTYDIPVDMDYDDPTQDLHIHFTKGTQELNGEEAVNMLRFRKNNNNKGGFNGDLGRIQNFQNFIKTLAKQVISPSTIPRIPKLAEAVMNNTTTDLTLGEMTWFGLEGMKLDMEKIGTHTLPGKDIGVYEGPVYGTQSYWRPDEAGIIELINEKFNPYEKDVTAIQVIAQSRIYRYTKPVQTATSGTSGGTGPQGEENEAPVIGTPQEPSAGSGGSQGGQTPSENESPGGYEDEDPILGGVTGTA